MTHTIYSATSRTTIITVAKSKVKFTTVNLNADATAITSAGLNSVDVSGESGATNKDKLEALITRLGLLSISNSTVGTTVTEVTNSEGDVTGYTITLTDGTATDVSITAVLPVTAVKTTV